MGHSMLGEWFLWWNVHENGYSEPKLWRFEKELLTIAPLSRKQYGGHVQCTTCGEWINGYHSSINLHAREHRANGEDMDWIHFLEHSVFGEN